MEKLNFLIAMLDKGCAKGAYTLKEASEIVTVIMELAKELKDKPK